MQRKAKYYPRRNNAYVPRMDMAVDVLFNGPHEVIFGPVLLAATAAILSAQSMTTAGSATLGGTNALVVDNTDPIITGVPTQQNFPYGPGFGRNLTYVASGTSTGTVTTKGRDYLGQAMTEVITLNGATPVVGLKAFKYIDSITWTATSAITLSVGIGSRLGLPYRMQNVLSETADGVGAAAGTLTTPVLTDPQTTTTGDPRGTYTPTTTPDGVKIIAAVFIPNRFINSSGNGGLHGIAHV